MGRAVTLEGADNGLRYFFRPNWSELKNANVWINAASQNFNSLGISFGSMISFASYNKYNNNILRDTVAVSVVNVLTSLLVGVFAFATLGNLALEQNTNVKDVIGDGPGLIFVVYPQAMAKMPYAQLWAVMFFFMLLCLGLNSQVSWRSLGVNFKFVFIFFFYSLPLLKLWSLLYRMVSPIGLRDI